MTKAEAVNSLEATLNAYNLALNEIYVRANLVDDNADVRTLRETIKSLGRVAHQAIRFGSTQ